MKANRKFLSSGDEAVSPVIAVILMVAITVVLAATVYVWVSGFGAQSSNPSKTISFTSDGVIADAIDPETGEAHVDGHNDTDESKNYTISAATPGTRYSDIILSLDGAAVACEDELSGQADQWRVIRGGNFLTSWIACTTTNGAGPDSVIQAGDVIQIYDDGGGLSGKTLRILDANANSVILTLTVG